LPWEICKAFDNSAPLSRFIQKKEFPDTSDIHFRLDLNGKTVQQASTRDMIFSIEDLISYISGFITLKTGDIIFTGTPSGVGPVKIGDHLEGYIGERKMLNFFVK
jgi:2-keto-4-pentenoate hydratase/2-oxohepta-3-ene-1,7-dioic acid hydratase in catechol pathway